MTALLLASLLLSADAEPSVRLTSTKADEPPVVVAAIPPADAKAIRDPAAVLQVRVTRDGSVLFGEHAISANSITFVPRFPLEPGRTYHATLTLPGREPITVPLIVPKPKPLPPATVTHIYPSASVLPENTLRLYFTFSRPMTRGDAARYITLLDADNQPVPVPFLHFEQELWSADGTRFTLLFDPGRIKRELVPRQELGPPLVRGRKYTLVVDRSWPDENGQPLRETVRKSFTAGPPDSISVEPDRWVLIPPAAGTDRPVIIKLPKPLDRFLLERMLTVTDSDNQPIPGQVTVGGGERVLTFAPAAAWKPGRYRLVVDTRLEDVCGNRVRQPFEVDIFREVTERIVPEFVNRDFVVK